MSVGLAEPLDTDLAEPPLAERRGPGRSAVWTGAGMVAVGLGCAALALAVLIGTALLGLPVLAPVVAAGLLALPLLLVRPVWFLVLVTVVEAGNLSSVGAENGLPRGETVLLGLAVVAAFLAWTRGEVRPAWSPLLTAGLFYLGIQALAAFAADDLDTTLSAVVDATSGLSAVGDTAKSLVWPVVLLLLMLVPTKTPHAVARAFALTLALLSALTIFQEFGLGNATTFGGLSNVPLVADIGGVTARHAGPQVDANFWGRVLVLGLPFALSAAAMAGSRLAAWSWVVAAGLIGGGVVLTGSRGTLVAAFLVVCLWAALTGGRVAKALWFTPLVAGLALLIPGVGSRLLTLSTLGAGSGLALGDPSLEGRIAAQRVAIEMVVDHPFLGVGPGNFLLVEPQYLSRLALDTQPLAPHNQYLEAAAEGGLLGLAGWLVLLGTALVVAYRARGLARAWGPAVDRAAPAALSNAVLAALVGWALASAFLHLATFRTFLLVAVVGAALDVRARRRVAELKRNGVSPQPLGGAVAVERRDRRNRTLGRATAGVLVVGLVALAGAVWTVGSRPVTTWTAEAGMQLVVLDDGDSNSPAYDLDVLSRTAMVRTLAGIATNQRFIDEGLTAVEAAGGSIDGVTVTVTGSVKSALVTVQATAQEYERAAAVAAAVRTAAGQFITSISALYGVQDVYGGPVVEPSAAPIDRRLAQYPLELAAVITVGLAVSLVTGRSARRRAAPAEELAARA